MNITINGSTEAGDYSTVAELLASQGLDPKLVVVELNCKIVPAADFGQTSLQEGDSVEIVQFVAGG
ncbi:MAG: sulfur carrier protein ThiS [Desulfovibrio sp.]|nr:sulfur carrier protein ThiS [Desulfovibrio sp.]